MVVLILTAFTVAAQDREAPPATKPLAPGKDEGPRVKKDRPDHRDIDRGDKKSPRYKRPRVYLGVFTVPVEDLSNHTRKKMKLESSDGVIVVDIMPDSPATEAGLRHGDVITHVNGKVVEDEDELCEDLEKAGPGKPVKLSVVREGKKQEIKAELGDASANPHHSQFRHEEEREEMMEMCRINAERIGQLERTIARLQKRINDMEKSRSSRNKE